MLIPPKTALVPTYHRHRTERTALYAIVKEHYPRFVEYVERSGGDIPAFVRNEFEAYLECGLLARGFLRVKRDGCRHEHLVAFSCKRRRGEHFVAVGNDQQQVGPQAAKDIRQAERRHTDGFSHTDVAVGTEQAFNAFFNIKTIFANLVDGDTEFVGQVRRDSDDPQCACIGLCQVL